MIKLCIDARMIHSSGIGTYIKNLLLQLINGPFKLILIADPSAHVLKDLNADLEVIPCNAGIYSIKEQLELPRLIPKCDVFWSPHYNIPVLPIRAKKRLVTIHDLYHLAFISTLRPLEKIYAKSVMQRAVRISDHIITDSYFSKEELKKYTQVDEKKVSVVHLGVNEKLFAAHPEKQLIHEAKEKYKLPEKFFLFVGNTKPHKNLKKLLEAFRILLQDGLTDHQLLIVGKKEGFKTIEDVSTILENDPLLSKYVTLMGLVEEKYLPVFYHLATLMVLPSFYEGFGLPPLEAMSAGCPVVVSNAGSLPEICGNSAIYVNPHDSKDIAQGLKNVLKNEELRNDLRKKGYLTSQTFRWKTTAQNHIQLIEEMCRS